MGEKQRKVIAELDQAGIAYEVIEHPAVYTIEDMESLHLDHMEEVAKNLFLKDDKGKRHFLVVLHKDKKADLKLLRMKLESRPLSFASEERLRGKLGLEKGAVTPFGVLNDEERLVEVIFDQDLTAFPLIGVHPNENTATVFLRLEDLESFIRDHGNSVSRIAL